MDNTKVNVEITGEKILDILMRFPKMQEDITEIKKELKANISCRIRCNAFDTRLSKIEEDISGLKSGVDKINADKTDFQSWFKRTIVATILTIFLAAMAALLYKGIKYDRQEQSKSKVTNKVK